MQTFILKVPEFRQMIGEQRNAINLAPIQIHIIKNNTPFCFGFRSYKKLINTYYISCGPFYTICYMNGAGLHHINLSGAIALPRLTLLNTSLHCTLNSMLLSCSSQENYNQDCTLL